MGKRRCAQTAMNFQMCKGACNATNRDVLVASIQVRLVPGADDSSMSRSRRGDKMIRLLRRGMVRLLKKRSGLVRLL